MTTARVEKPEAAPEPVRPRLYAVLFHVDETWRIINHAFGDIASATHCATGDSPAPSDRILTIPTDSEQAAHDEYVRALEAFYRENALTLAPDDSVYLAVQTAKAALDAERAKP